MKINEVLKPIKKQESFVLKLLDKKRLLKSKCRKYIEVKNQILKIKENQRFFNLFSRSHLSKIKNLSMIEYK